MTVCWRFIDSGEHNACRNMAIDEALLLSGDNTPVLRFYRWENPSISVGFFQKLKEELNVDGCRESGIEIVRRPTGGGLVFHGERTDFTYTFVFPATQVYTAVQDSYRMVHEAVIISLQKLDIPASHALESMNDAMINVCSFKPTKYDVLVHGKKIAGAAQRRIKNKILHQGYICLGEMKTNNILAGNIKGKEYLFRERSIPLSWLREVTREKLKAIVQEGFEECFNITLLASELDESEKAMADTLYAAKYTRPDWNYRR